MNERSVRTALAPFFPKSFEDGATFLNTDEWRMVCGIIERIEKEPISRTEANQLLHLCHEGGISEGFFRYYFLERPGGHPHKIEAGHSGEVPDLTRGGVTSLVHLAWALNRFYTDALLYWGNLRSAYRELRGLGFDEIGNLFQAKRINQEEMAARGDHYPFHEIDDNDRYLISELACKAYDCVAGADLPAIGLHLVGLYRKVGKPKVRIGELLDEKEEPFKSFDPDSKYIVMMGAEDLREKEIESEGDIHREVAAIRSRFGAARPKAADNTRLYLSLVNELDVYVATSMRTKKHFEDMAENCRKIFKGEDLGGLKIRYFDPTMSAAACHEDKGLIECLMVKCSKATLYFAGETDSYGKDAEVAMSLSLGKPVLILCPDDERGKQREKFFRDIHPLSRLINFDTGVANGAIVTRSVKQAAILLRRIFTNTMEYTVDRKGDDYFLLKEKLTGSVVRLQTNDRLLRESFWNYYHGVS